VINIKFFLIQNGERQPYWKILEMPQLASQ